MIKPNVIIALLIVCVLLMAGLFLLKGDRPKVNLPKDLGEKLIKDFNRDGVKTVEIKKGDVALKLEKKGNDWVMPNQKGRLAKLDRVNTLLDDTKSALKEGRRASTDDTEFELCESGEKARTEVTFESEAAKTTLYLGKSPDFGKTFVRTEAGGPIYEADKGLDTDAGVRTEGEKRILDAAYFYDLKVFGFNSDDIIDISIKKGHEVARVQKVIAGKGPVQPKQELGKDEKPAWWVTEPEGAAADESNVGSICSNLSGLNAKSYADTVPEKDRGFDKPQAKVKVVLKDGTEHTLTFGKAEGDDILVSVAGKPDPYKVYKYVFESLTKDLKKKEEEKKDDKKAETPAPKADEKNADAPKAVQKVEAPIPPPPPAKIEANTKPALPPAVVKKADETPKVEEKK
jgi:hypothetical protein